MIDVKNLDIIGIQINTESWSGKLCYCWKLICCENSWREMKWKLKERRSFKNWIMVLILVLFILIFYQHFFKVSNLLIFYSFVFHFHPNFICFASFLFCFCASNIDRYRRLKSEGHEKSSNSIIIKRIQSELRVECSNRGRYRRRERRWK